MTEAEEPSPDYLRNLKAGDEEAARVVWERYVGKLRRLASKRLRGSAQRAADDEDVVLSAFNSFCTRAAGGQFPQLETADDLWKLLATITSRKAAALKKRERADKRGGGKTRGESALDVHDPSTGKEQRGIGSVPDERPAPDRQLEYAEQFDNLLARLDDPALREIALCKMAAHTNEEIAAKLEISLSTVERKLRAIRLVWAKDSIF